MPSVTFSSPLLRRAVTVFIEGHEASNILALAEAHRIPLPHDCGEGQCGVCMIDVLTLSGKMLGSCLTDKEKKRLAAIGKITPEEIRRAEIADIAPRYRLACQYVVRHEDVLVTFAGRSGGA
jgi:ferredoxin